MSLNIYSALLATQTLCAKGQLNRRVSVKERSDPVCAVGILQAQNREQRSLNEVQQPLLKNRKQGVGLTWQSQQLL